MGNKGYPPPQTPSIFIPAWGVGFSRDLIWVAKRRGSNFILVGGLFKSILVGLRRRRPRRRPRRPSPSVVAHSLTLRLPLPYQSLTTRFTKSATRCEGSHPADAGGRGDGGGGAGGPLAYASLTISLPIPYRSLHQIGNKM